MENFIYLPEISDDGSVIKTVKLHWITQDEMEVRENDILMEMITDTGKIYPVVAPQSGILFRFIVDDNITLANHPQERLDTCNCSKVCIGAVYKTYEDYIESFYKFKAEVEIDSFTSEKTIRWDYIAEPVVSLPISAHGLGLTFGNFKLVMNNLKKKDVSDRLFAQEKGLLLGGLLSDKLKVSFIINDGKCFMEFSYNEKELKLRKNDMLSFMFANGDIIDFRLSGRPYKKSDKSNKRYFKCQLYAEDIDIISKNLLIRWRITYCDESRPPFTFVVAEADNSVLLLNAMLYGDTRSKLWHYDSSRRTPLLIQSFTKYFCGFLEKNIPEFEFPRRLLYNKTNVEGIYNFEWCYVYLMKDVSNNFYKIGISKTPEYREQTLQSEKPTIEMICNKKYPSRKIAEAFEKALHTAYANKRVRGEWFALDDYDVMTLKESFK